MGTGGVCVDSAPMIIACPACATRYVVPDSAVGPEGRTVRCAKCKHSWFQDGPELAEPIAAAYATPVEAEAGASAPLAKRPPPAVRGGAPPPRQPPPSVGVGEAPTAPPPVPTTWVDVDATGGESAATDVSAFGDKSPPVDWAQAPAPPVAVEEVSQFDREPPFRPRRNWVRWLTWGAGVFAVLALAAVAAMSVLGMPSWLPIEKPLFGADPGLKVEFPASEQERRTLPNGAEFFGARVVVKNEARETKRVPPLLIVLRDARERVVYSWELVPPQRTLAPGEAMTINEAMTDVPKSAVYADIGWAPR